MEAPVLMYKTIEIAGLPMEEVQHMYDICIGDDGTPTCQRKNIAETHLIVITTQDRIDAKVASGVSLDTLFPAGRVTDYDYEGLKAESRKVEWQGEFV
jgi:hypothetical protein